MKQIIGMACMTLIALTGCSKQPEQIEGDSGVTSLAISGVWLKDSDGNVMADPQTSGLTVWEDKLVSLSDGSASSDLQRKLHFIDSDTATVASDAEKMRLANVVRRSCFSGYLANEPDLEALTADPIRPGVFYTVTEDATRTGALSASCEKKYEDTGSTDYPTLLVRLEKTEFGTIMTGVKPLKFAQSFNVGDFPNDGIEGLAMGTDDQLYLALEKDGNGQPRVFTMTLNEGFWKDTNFAEVQDPALNLPTFASGNHPINGLAFYQVGEKSFLLAAARNDNELWILSTDKSVPFKRIPLHFTAPTEGNPENCEATEVMDNASIEGIAVKGDTLWMVNDPWKVNYLKNVQCAANQGHYEAMAPLLFSTPLDSAWFE
ncbi:hypothetical protein [Alteromonas sp. C1M14]|uniref:hypothetical protein n=1 Tax=Alteromonas sp. C1M14 TaxID=2841567 RepID=UPI001C092C28|nr:hypothetical protein [Alteromonas sp. C1M14]MBU2976634.1 hypothetical protein [Alteromonas sp. C1M14]